MADTESALMRLARERVDADERVVDSDAVLGVLWLNLLSRRYASWLQATMKAIGLDENEAAILASLRLQRPRTLTVGWFKDTLMITSGGVTRAVDRLVAKGLVERRRVATDGRSTVVLLTARGRRRAAEIFEVISRGHAERMARLDPARRKELLGALDDLLELYGDIDPPR